MATVLRACFVVFLLASVANAQLLDCFGCRGTIIGIGGASGGVSVIVDNLGATSGSCTDPAVGECSPVASCSFAWNLSVLIAPGSAAISRITICPTSNRGNCLGGAAVNQSPLFQNTYSFVAGYAVACGWKHEQDILDLGGAFVGGISVYCSPCTPVTSAD